MDYFSTNHTVIKEIGIMVVIDKLIERFKKDKISVLGLIVILLIISGYLIDKYRMNYINDIIDLYIYPIYRIPYLMSIVELLVSLSFFHLYSHRIKFLL